MRASISGDGRLITYMRTDSVQLSGEASPAPNLVEADYGQRYLPEKPASTTKAKNARGP
jgi:DNA topoisomerase IA